MSEKLECLIISVCRLHPDGTFLPGAIVACREMAACSPERTEAVLKRCIQQGITASDIYAAWNDDNDRRVTATLNQLEARTA